MNLAAAVALGEGCAARLQVFKHNTVIVHVAVFHVKRVAIGLDRLGLVL